MSEWRTFITDNYTFDKNKGYVLDTSRPTPKFLQRLNKGINKTFRTLRTSNPFNLTTPSVPRTGEVSQVTGGSSDNKRPTGTTFVDKIKNIPTSSAVTGITFPSESNIRVIPIFLPIKPLISSDLNFYINARRKI